MNASAANRQHYKAAHCEARQSSAFFRFDSMQFYRCLSSFSLNPLQVLKLSMLKNDRVTAKLLRVRIVLSIETDKSRSKSITSP